MSLSGCGCYAFGGADDSTLSHRFERRGDYTGTDRQNKLSEWGCAINFSIDRNN